MPRTMEANSTHSSPLPPPLFVTAVSEMGEHQEALVERDTVAPSWLTRSPRVRVQSPGGHTRVANLDGVPVENLYERLLHILGGADLAWAPAALHGRVPQAALDRARERIDNVECWVFGNEEPKLNAGPLFSFGEWRHQNPECIVVVRRSDKSAVYVPHADHFYIELLPSPNGTDAVPRALVDTGLAGAYWGYSEHHLGDASRIAARLLLQRLFDGSSGSPDAAWIAAAAHAVLFHRELLSPYGQKVSSLLGAGTVPEADARFLIALLGMAMLGLKLSDEDKVRSDLRSAISALAKDRVTYGETLRLLDAKFSVIVDIAQREMKDEALSGQIEAISGWLSKAYVGGQIAAYAGEAPLLGGDWHDALAQKKTSLIF